MSSSTDPSRKSSSGAGRVPLRLEEHDGECALFVSRRSAPARLGAAIMAVLVLAAVAAGVLALLRGSTALGAVLLALAALLGGLLLRNPFTGGVWLTPTSLSTRRGRAGWTTPWDDVAAVSYTGSHSSRRDELGTDGSLDEAQAVRAAYGGSGFRPVVFRPVVQGSPTSTRGAMLAGAAVLAGLVLVLAALGRASSVDDDLGGYRVEER